MLPNKIFQKSARLIFEKCTSGYRRALLANSNCEFASSECKWRVWQHRLCLLFSVSHNSKRHFLKWKSAATAALSAQKRKSFLQKMLFYCFTSTALSRGRFSFHDVPASGFLPDNVPARRLFLATALRRRMFPVATVLRRRMFPVATVFRCRIAPCLFLVYN